MLRQRNSRPPTGNGQSGKDGGLDILSITRRRVAARPAKGVAL
jgi:hypothetical protein